MKESAVKMNFERVHAEINLDNLLFNVREMKKVIPEDSKIMAVIKADAYGNGAVETAQTLEKQDEIGGFCTATFDEAIELRNNNINKPILVLGLVFPSDYDEMIRSDIRPTVYDLELAEKINKSAEKIGKKAKIHIKIDTGMGRIGFQPDEKGIDDIISISRLPFIDLEGIFTHFSRCDEKEKKYADNQQACFEKTISRLRESGITFTFSHSANSAAIMEYPPAYSKLVRAGITLYGMWPSNEVDHSFPLKSVMTLKASVIYVKVLPAGCPIGYGGTYVTDKDTKIATVSIGYADGMPRSLSNKGEVLIHGRRVPIIGRICMDQMMVDVTDIPDVNMFDTVTIIGTDGKEEITMEEVGDKSGRFNYELSCLLGNRRIPKIYFLDGKEVKRTFEM